MNIKRLHYILSAVLAILALLFLIINAFIYNRAINLLTTYFLQSSLEKLGSEIMPDLILNNFSTACNKLKEFVNKNSLALSVSLKHKDKIICEVSNPKATDKFVSCEYEIPILFWELSRGKWILTGKIYTNVSIFQRLQFFTKLSWILIIFLYIGIAIIIFIYLNKKLLLPLTHLLSATKTVQEGNLNIKIQEEGIKEVKELIVHFNTMTEELRIKTSLLEKLARVDSLTGLFNRRYFFKLAQREHERALRENKPYTIIMIDIDDFKRINDIYGHLVGDEILKQTAQILKTHTRKYDIIGRYGGEEFIILCPNTDLDQAKSIAERIRQTMKKHSFKTKAGYLHCTISVGVSILHDKESLDALIKRADDALYIAKKTGKNKTVVK